MDIWKIKMTITESCCPRTFVSQQPFMSSLEWAWLRLDFWDACVCVPIACRMFLEISLSSLRYPEIFPREQLYNTPAQLKKMLKNYCKNPSSVRERKNRREIQDSLLKFEWNQIKETYITWLWLCILVLDIRMHFHEWLWRKMRIMNELCFVSLLFCYRLVITNI